jgi:exopolysaccharide biosynthesis polyprenyl glycosylphosphotransferase
MFNKPSNSMTSLIDSTIALTITVFSFLPLHRALAAAERFQAIRVTLSDALVGIGFIFAWHYCFSLLKLYDRSATLSSRTLGICKGVALIMPLIVIYLRLFHPGILRASSVASAALALLVYEMLRLAIYPALLERMASRDPRRAIIIGSGRRASKAWRALRTRYYSSIAVLGFVDERDPQNMAPDVARRFLGGVDQLEDLLLREVVDVILIAMPIQSCYSLMQRAVHIAESAGVQVMYLSDIYSSRHRQGSESSMFRDLAPQQEHYLVRLAAKRIVDICGAVVGLILLAPAFLLIALGVKLSSKGPIFFRQERYGHFRRRFKMAKFRSMVHNAEELHASLEHANEAVGPIFKIKKDPRVTKFGKLIRATSLDELPQLWNVLLGDMSLVGPRPMSIRDVSLFSEAGLMRRFSVKPGMTGLWQVNGRSAVGFDEWMAMDNRYIDGWSLGLDLKILARTVGVVIKRSGAM